MEFRNHQYNQFGTIDAEVNNLELGWIPCTFCLDDPPTSALFHAAAPTAKPYVEPEE